MTDKPQKPTPDGQTVTEDTTKDVASKIAKLLGSRGGNKTKQRGSGYYRQINKLGQAKRWGKKDAKDKA